MIRILVVEDDVLTGLALEEQLTDLGATVIVHRDAESAMSQLFHEFDAAIIDVTLPGMSGDDLARECRRRVPEMAIVLATGRPEQEIRAKFRSDAKVEVLEKPYEFHEVRERLLRLRVAI